MIKRNKNGALTKDKKEIVKGKGAGALASR